MIKDYCKATIEWQKLVNSGYGPTYATAVSVSNVYIEKSVQLIRGLDNTTSADASFITHQELAFKEGDKVTLGSRSYTITWVNEYAKPRSTDFDHVECMLTEVQYG